MMQKSLHLAFEVLIYYFLITQSVIKKCSLRASPVFFFYDGEGVGLRGSSTERANGGRPVFFFFDGEGERGGLLLLRGSAWVCEGERLWSVGRGSMVVVGDGGGRWWTFSDPTMVLGERESMGF